MNYDEGIDFVNDTFFEDGYFHYKLMFIIDLEKDLYVFSIFVLFEDYREITLN